MIFAVGGDSLTLTNPDWGESEATVRTLIMSRAMIPGVAYSYVREPNSGGSNPIQRYSYTFSNIDRSKLKEIVSWLERNISNEVTVTNIDTSTLTGKFVNTEQLFDVIRQGHYYGTDDSILSTQYEGMSITFEFEGYFTT